MNVRLTPCAPQGVVQAPTSKSVLHRLLICAALAQSPSRLHLADRNDDIDATVRCLRAIGVSIEESSGVWTVIPPKKWNDNALLDCGESGSTLRFLLPVVASLGLSAVFTGKGRLPERPNDALLAVMQSHGVAVEAGFPIRIGGRLEPGEYRISGAVSSQYATGLLLALSHLSAPSTLTLLPPVASAPYLNITLDVLHRFGAKIEQTDYTYAVSPAALRGGDFTAEGDWSGAAALLACGFCVGGLDPHSAQGDRRFLDIMSACGAQAVREHDTFRLDLTALHGAEINAGDVPDLVPVLAAVLATADGVSRITNAQNLRHKESDRLAATAALLCALGADVKETADGLLIRGKPLLNGGTTDSANDHRIVMAAAVAAQKCKAPVIIQNAQSISKSFPGFFNLYRTQGGTADVQ